MLARTPQTQPNEEYRISGSVIRNGVKAKFKATWLGDTVGNFVVEITDHFGERTTCEFVSEAEVWAQIGIGVAVATDEARQVMKQTTEYGT
jgi:hypothetical protein